MKIKIHVLQSIAQTGIGRSSDVASYFFTYLALLDLIT